MIRCGALIWSALPWILVVSSVQAVPANVTGANTTSEALTNPTSNATYKSKSSSYSSLTTSSSASTLGVGGYIASGLGIVTSSEGTQSDASTLPVQSSTAHSKSTTSATSNSTGDIPSTVHTTGYTNTTANVPTSASFTSGTVISGNSTGNSSIDQCWSSWSSWWAANDTLLNPLTSYSVYSTVGYTYTETELLTFDPETAYTTTWSTAGTFTSTEVENGFTQNTFTSTFLRTYTETQSAEAGSTETDIYTFSGTSSYTTTISNAGQTAATPDCILPPVVSQCASEWSAYEVYQSAVYDIPTCDYSSAACTASLNAWESSWSTLSVTKPACTQASIGGRLCDVVRSDYLSEWFQDQDGNPYGAGQVTGAGYAPYTTQTIVANGTLTQISALSAWPTTSSLAPGCTLGCARCAVTGGSVRLIYWPQGSATANSTLSSTVGGKNDSRIAVTLGMTFTSPTLYISFGTVFASDSCSGIGPTDYNIIVPITASELSSLWATYPAPGQLSTASFNVTDLNEPVPQSIYNSQLRCAASTGYAALNNQGNTAITALSQLAICASTLPYEPILVVPTSLLDGLNPAWSACSADIRGLYDPPIALTPVNAPAAPTVPNAPSSQSATPAQSASPQSARPTATPTPAPITPTSGDPDSISSTHDASLPTSSNDPTSSADSNSPGANSTPAAPSASADPGATVGGAIGSIFHSDGSSSGDSDAAPTQAQVSDLSHLAAVSLTSSTTVLGASVGGAIASLFGGNGGSIAPHPHDPTNSAESETASIDNAHSSDSGGETSADPGVSAAATTSDVGGSGSGSGTTVDANPAAATSYVQIATAGGHTIAPAPGSSGGVVIAGTTLAVGASTVISGTPVVVQPGSVVVGDSTFDSPGTAAGPVPQATFSVNGQTYTATSDSPVAFAGTTLTAGQAATIAGHIVSVGSNDIVLDGSTASFSDPTAAVATAKFTLNGQVYTVETGQPVTLSGTTIAPGQAATISGVAISEGSSGIVVGGQTIGFSPATVTAAAPPTEVAAPFTVSGTTYVAYQVSGHPGTIIIDGVGGQEATLSVGGPGTTLNGAAVSAATEGVVVSGFTVVFQTPTASILAEATFTASSGTYTVFKDPGASTAVVVGTDGTSTTLTVDGAAITVAGESLSVASDGLVLDGSTTDVWKTVTVGLNGALVPAGAGMLSSASNTVQSSASTTTSDAVSTTSGPQGSTALTAAGASPSRTTTSAAALSRQVALMGWMGIGLVFVLSI